MEALHFKSCSLDSGPQNEAASGSPVLIVTHLLFLRSLLPATARLAVLRAFKAGLLTAWAGWFGLFFGPGQWRPQFSFVRLCVIC